MFLAIIFIVLGFILLLNAFGLIGGSFWGLFWAIIFLAIGFKLLQKQNKCPWCQGRSWTSKMHEHMHNHQNSPQDKDQQ